MGDWNDPRPAGDWTVSMQPRNDGSGVVLVIANDAGSNDRVVAHFHKDDNSPAYWGLPADLDMAKVLHLHRIEPRKSKARGGTTSLLHHLGQFADKNGYWLTAENQPEVASRKDLVRGVLEKHGFRCRSTWVFEHVMVRPPQGQTYTTIVDPPAVKAWCETDMNEPQPEEVRKHLDLLFPEDAGNR